MTRLILVSILVLFTVGYSYSSERTLSIEKPTIIMNKPSENGKPIMRVFPGTTLTVIDNQASWFKVKTQGGDTGWVYRYWFSSKELGEELELEPKTVGSGNPSQLKMGLSRQAVINLLGSPTWAVIPSDRGDFELPDKNISLALYWKNTPCNPIAVDFDKSYKSFGWDEGRAYCGDDASILDPTADYNCTKADRSKFCR